MSFHFDDWRHRILAVENGCAGHIHAQPEYEFAYWRGQPVGFMDRRSGVLDINVDGTVGIRNEAGAIADAVPIDRIRHKVILRVTHSQRPECIVRRELSCWEVQDVVVLAVEFVARAIFGRRPIHRLLRYVYGRKFVGARGFEQHAIAGLAASENGSPAVDRRDIGVHENLGRDERQHAADNDALHHVRDDGSPEHDGEHPFACIS
jgi:hypothetical protein